VVFLANQNKELAAARLIMIKDFQGQNAYIYLDEWSNPNKGVSNYLKCKEEIRKYLDSVFTKKNRAKYYDKENSALYFPVISGDNIAVLCFEKRMEYGRLGS
ncbi:MAG: hypothetical protein WCK36_01935, partial [Candidatus Firestonebacteria bacterium]